MGHVWHLFVKQQLNKIRGSLCTTPNKEAPQFEANCLPIPNENELLWDATEQITNEYMARSHSKVRCPDCGGAPFCYSEVSVQVLLNVEGNSWSK